MQLLSTEELVAKWQKELKKGFAKPLLLKAISKGRSYPYKLTKIIEEETKGQIKIATTNIYPLLRDLVDDGLIIKFDDPETFRTYYQITETGKKFLFALASTIEEFFSIMNHTLLEDIKDND